MDEEGLPRSWKAVASARPVSDTVHSQAHLVTLLFQQQVRVMSSHRRHVGWCRGRSRGRMWCSPASKRWGPRVLRVLLLLEGRARWIARTVHALDYVTCMHEVD